MKILITGAGGFVGSHLINYLFLKKLNVKGVIRNIHPPYLNKKIKIIKADLIKIKKNIGDYDCIIYCAVEEPGIKNFLKVKENNIKAINNIFKYTKKLKQFIYLSSMAVYGENSNKFIYENSSINKQTNYGKIKYEIEKLCIKKSKKHNFNLSILRLPGVVGFGSKDNFISKTYNSIQNNKIVLANNPDSFFNNIITSQKLNNFIYELILKKPKNNIYTFGSKYPLKIRTVISIIAKLLKRKILVKFLDTKQKPFLIKYDNALQMGYRPLTVKESLKLYIKSNLNK